MAVFVIFALVMVAADQALKALATAYLAPVGQVELIPGVFGLRYVLNDGMAFSLFGGGRWPLVILTTIMLVAVAGYLAFKKPRGLLFWACCCIFAGGEGNLIDRVRTGLVVDYLEFRFVTFPVFNLADILVTVGAGLLLLWALLDSLAQRRQAGENQDGTV